MNKFLVIGVVLIAAVAGGFLLLRSSPAEPVPSDGEATYRLIVIADSVTLAHDGQAAQGVQGTVEVVEGDTVSTSATGRARLRWPNGTLTTIEEDSQVVIREIANGGAKSRLELIVGDVWSKVERVFGTGEYYEVQTQDTVAAVRGTVFRTTYRNKQSRVQTIERTIRVFMRTDAGRADESTGLDVEESMTVTLERDSGGVRRFNKRRLNAEELRDRVIERIKEERDLTDDEVRRTPKPSPSITPRPSVSPIITPRPSALLVTPTALATPTPSPTATPLPAVRLENVFPRTIKSGDTFSLEGANFTFGRNVSRIETVLVDGKPVADVLIVGATSIFVTPNQLATGVHSVGVITTDGQTVTLQSALTVQ